MTIHMKIKINATEKGEEDCREQVKEGPKMMAESYHARVDRTCKNSL